MGERDSEAGERDGRASGKGRLGRKEKRIRGFSRRRVEWLGGRIIELPLIPSSSLCWVKRGKKPARRRKRFRLDLSCLCLCLVSVFSKRIAKCGRRRIYRRRKKGETKENGEKGKQREYIYTHTHIYIERERKRKTKTEEREENRGRWWFVPQGADWGRRTE